jgi:hypothetical protein
VHILKGCNTIPQTGRQNPLVILYLAAIIANFFRHGERCTGSENKRILVTAELSDNFIII